MSIRRILVNLLLLERERPYFGRLTISDLPPLHAETRSAATSDTCESSVPTKPVPSEWIAWSTAEPYHP